MDVFQAFKTQVKTQLTQQKSKKIYVFNRRKSKNLNQKKLNELIHVNNFQTPKKKHEEEQGESFLERSIRKYLSEGQKGNRLFALAYEEGQEEGLDVGKKRREVRNKITSNFHISGFRTQKDQERRRRKQCKSFEGNKEEVGSLSQLQSQKSCNNYPKSTKDQEPYGMMIPPKKHSLPHLSKRSITFSDKWKEVAFLTKNSRSPLHDSASPILDETQFIKMGVVSGSKISSLPISTKHPTTLHPNEQLPRPLRQSCPSQPQPLSDQYYSLIRKTDYKKMTNHAGEKVIRNNYLQNRKRRSLERESIKITQLHGRSLVRLEEIVSHQKVREVGQV